MKIQKIVSSLVWALVLALFGQTQIVLADITKQVSICAVTGKDPFSLTFVVDSAPWVGRNYLIRARGITHPDTVLNVLDGSGYLVSRNDDNANSPDLLKIRDWQTRLNLANLPKETDSAVVVTLQNGTYNVMVTGYENYQSGTVALEIYEVPNRPAVIQSFSLDPVPAVGNGNINWITGSDPDGDDIQFLFDWDNDGKWGEGSGYMKSGSKLYFSHIWSTPGVHRFTIGVVDGINGQISKREFSLTVSESPGKG